MKLAAPFLSIACLLMTFTATANAQQLFKTVNADGKITYSDTPPVAGKVVTQNVGNANQGNDTSGLPYELAQAAKNFPVTLYSADKCAPCNEGRQLLQSRGIPFTEKTVNRDGDVAALKEINGNSQIPLLLIGREKVNGFSSSDWSSALTTAGYPKNSQLPKSYHNGQISTAAATPAITDVVARSDNRKTNNAADHGKIPPAAGNAPPGFQF
ncbi:glutaredoxin family protein [Glaciimonas soli]|nr:glutaredoxin family protein [Glaciimonas soli]